MTVNSSTWNASSSASQGRDTIDLSDVNGPVLNQQLIIGIESTTPFLGSLGLAVAPSSFEPSTFLGRTLQTPVFCRLSKPRLYTRSVIWVLSRSSI